MLKMYQSGGTGGGSEAFWESNWSDDRLHEAIRFCAIDPLRPLFERYAPVGSRMLEGGCGQGQYVAYYASRGLRLVGLDFAREALARLHASHPGLAVCVGNVAALPFCSGSFDVYYSGGVVEHFERGTAEALDEARRVLRPGGTFLVSVPYFSPVRRLLRPFRASHWRQVENPSVDTAATGPDLRFWQYAYTQQEFTRILRRAGFTVILRQGYSILWGLYDVPGIAAAASQLARRRNSVSSGEGPIATTVEKNEAAGLAQPPSEPGRPGTLKRLVVSEDSTVPVAGLFVRALRQTCANMMMYVCQA